MITRLCFGILEVTLSGIKGMLSKNSELNHNSWKNLRVSTIRSYLSGLKKLHMLNHCHTSQFDDPLLLFYLSGLKNWENSVVLPSLQRNVMTFATLKIWGHAICCSNLSYFDQQVLWTGMYIFHFFFLLIFFLQFFISF